MGTNEKDWGEKVCLDWKSSILGHDDGGNMVGRHAVRSTARRHLPKANNYPHRLFFWRIFFWKRRLVLLRKPLPEKGRFR